MALFGLRDQSCSTPASSGGLFPAGPTVTPMHSAVQAAEKDPHGSSLHFTKFQTTLGPERFSCYLLPREKN